MAAPTEMLIVSSSDRLGDPSSVHWKAIPGNARLACEVVGVHVKVPVTGLPVVVCVNEAPVGRKSPVNVSESPASASEQETGRES